MNDNVGLEQLSYEMKVIGEAFRLAVEGQFAKGGYYDFRLDMKLVAEQVQMQFDDYRAKRDGVA